MVRSYKFSYIKQMSRIRNKNLNVVNRRGFAIVTQGEWTIAGAFNMNLNFPVYSFILSTFRFTSAKLLSYCFRLSFTFNIAYILK